MLITKKNKYWLLSVSFLLLAIFAVVLYLQLHQNRLLNKTVEYNESNVSWGVFQLEREALKFMNGLNWALDHTNAEVITALLLRFDILWSRFDVVAINPASGDFLDSKEYASVLKTFKNFLVTTDQYLENDPAAFGRDTILRVRDRLQSELAPLQALSNLALHRASEHAAMRSMQVSDQIRISTGLVIFQLLLTLLFFFLIVRLVRKLQISHEELNKLANFDALTGIPNRRLFYDRLGQELLKAERLGSRVALLYIDLDNFKDVNDTQGHEVGDQLLKEATLRLRNAVRKSDTVSRLSGDEFTVVIPDLEEYELVAQISEGILRQLQVPFRNGAFNNFISASIGITIYPDDAEDTNTLLKNADQAMYEAKRNGRNQYHYFTDEMQQTAQWRLKRINDLRTALQKKQFRLNYQPIVDLNTGRIHKAEALICWLHPDQGLVSPNDFIPLLEETGLIVDVSDWVFEEAAKQSSIWREKLDPEFQVSINTSPVQYRANGTRFESWVSYIETAGLEGSAIAMEITEGILMDSAASQRLLEMQNVGFEVSLDDFGTGYSTLSYLKKFNIDYLKIDKSFVQNLHPSSSDFALCEAIIVMAHKLGIKVIAEGVETDVQRAYLTNMGCDYGQGYLFSKPVNTVEFERLVRNKTFMHDVVLPYDANI